jgi:hypothetical protein
MDVRWRRVLHGDEVSELKSACSCALISILHTAYGVYSKRPSSSHVGKSAAAAHPACFFLSFA